MDGAQDTEPTQVRLAIIGAGPAGLAAAYAARSLDPTIVESGFELDARRRDEPVSTVQGVGGAGLYSDGKFSFFPSATHLWELEETSLAAAYGFLTDLLRQAGLAAPAFPRRHVPRHEAGDLQRKSYPSSYVGLEERISIIRTLRESCNHLRTAREVQSISPLREGWALRMEEEILIARNIIIATGRFGPLLLRSTLPQTSLVTRRFEVGVRIEQPSEEFFLREQSDLDPKLILSDQGQEWRTFCCCREGEIVRTTSSGLTTLSGRADVKRTGRSNVGFNVRVTDSNAPVLWDVLHRRLQGLERTAQSTLPDFMSSRGMVAELLGSEVTARLVDGLDRLMHAVGRDRFTGAQVSGPTIEGVGVYPLHDEFLSVRGVRSLWVAGDVAGDFRGLTSALVSGYVAGRSVTKRGRGPV